MDKFECALKLIDNCCGNEKEVILALATIAQTKATNGLVRPAVRMVCAYYEDGSFFISTDATKNKMLQIEKNNQVAVAGMDWFSFNGTATNLGWVKDEKNAIILAKFRKVFDWFSEVGDEDNPNSIILKIDLIDGVIIDHAKRYGFMKYEIDFAGKTAK